MQKHREFKGTERNGEDSQVRESCSGVVKLGVNRSDNEMSCVLAVGPIMKRGRVGGYSPVS